MTAYEWVSRGRNQLNSIHKLTCMYLQSDHEISGDCVFLTFIKISITHICASANNSNLLLIQSKNSRPLCDMAYAWSFCGNLNQLSKNTTSVHYRSKWERKIKYIYIYTNVQAIFFWREIIQCCHVILFTWSYQVEMLRLRSWLVPPN